jgi:hypothetical protein
VAAPAPAPTPSRSPLHPPMAVRPARQL